MLNFRSNFLQIPQKSPLINLFSVLFLGLSLSGCQLATLYHAQLDEQISELDKLNSIASNAQPMTPQFEEKISSPYVRKYISRPFSKVMAAAFPTSCSYRFNSYNYGDIKTAATEAVKRCNAALEKYNRDFGKNCNCSVVAINNTFIYNDNKIYFPDTRPDIPFIAEIVNNSEISNYIKGQAVFQQINALTKNYPFIVRNDTGNEVCIGTQTPSSGVAGKEGKLEINCFDGKISGSGNYVSVGVDMKLGVSSGSALINLTDGSKMRVVYGKNAVQEN